MWLPRLGGYANHATAVEGNIVGLSSKVMCKRADFELSLNFKNLEC